MKSFSIGGAISRASSLVSGTLGSVGLFVVILQFASLVLTYFLRGRMVGAMGGAQAMVDPNTQLAVFSSGWYWLTVVWSTAAASLMFAGATVGMLKAQDGEAVTLGDCFAGGLPKMLPVLGLLILWGLGIYAGFVLLVVPGCILVAAWSVTVPALIAEDTGVFGAFGRSRALTKGSRWKIFLLLLIVVVVIYFGLGVMVATVGLQWAGFALSVYTSGTVQVIMGLFGVVFSLAINALLVSIYGELIALKGERMSGVFD